VSVKPINRATAEALGYEVVRGSEWTAQKWVSNVDHVVYVIRSDREDEALKKVAALEAELELQKGIVRRRDEAIADLKEHIGELLESRESEMPEQCPRCDTGGQNPDGSWIGGPCHCEEGEDE